MENHYPIYKWPSYNLPGLILRQTWNIMSFFLLLAFSGILKSILIKTQDPKLLEFNDEVMNAGMPVILGFMDVSNYESLQYSPYKVDQWLYHNAENVYYFMRYYLS